MKVILKQDVKKVGKKGDIVDVSDGYGRNYLIARGLAVAESKKSLEILGEQKAEEARLEAQRVEEAKQLAEKMEKMMHKILDREAILERASREQEAAKTRSREMRTRMYWILESM